MVLKHFSENPVSVKEWTGKMIYFNFSSVLGDFLKKFLQKQSNKKESRVEQKAKINMFSDYSLAGLHHS
jgi:hypothetical protein